MELDLEFVKLFHLEQVNMDVSRSMWNLSLVYPTYVFDLVLGIKGLALKIYIESEVKCRNNKIATSIKARSGEKMTYTFSMDAVAYLTAESSVIAKQLTYDILDTPDAGPTYEEVLYD
jgi:hypothetical protein